MLVFCMFLFPFEGLIMNHTPAEVNGNFAINLKGESNMLSLLMFSCRAVGESMCPNWGWQLLDCRKHQKIQTLFGGIFVLYVYHQVELQELILKHSTYFAEMCGAEWAF